MAAAAPATWGGEMSDNPLAAIVSHLRDKKQSEVARLMTYVHFNVDKLAMAKIEGKIEILNDVLDDIEHRFWHVGDPTP